MKAQVKHQIRIMSSETKKRHKRTNSGQSNFSDFSDTFSLQKMHDMEKREESLQKAKSALIADKRKFNIKAKQMEQMSCWINEIIHDVNALVLD